MLIKYMPDSLYQQNRVANLFVELDLWRLIRQPNYVNLWQKTCIFLSVQIPKGYFLSHKAIFNGRTYVYLTQSCMECQDSWKHCDYVTHQKVKQKNTWCLPIFISHFETWTEPRYHSDLSSFLALCIEILVFYSTCVFISASMLAGRPCCHLVVTQTLIKLYKY